jgi:sulfate/thiosulfate transport system permease protein
VEHGVRGKPPIWLRLLVLVYLGLLVAGPVALVVLSAFADGVATFWAAISRPDALHALGLTLLITAIVVPANTVFGVLCALLLVRSRSPLRRVVNAVVNLPFALSPVVIGLALLLAYGNRGWFGPVLDALGWRVIFDIPGMVIATIFVTLPFVVREVEPVLREVGMDQEQAASTLGASSLQIFWRITLPGIRHAVGYGVVLTVARAVGEFGAVSIVSGHLAGRTETLTQYVDTRYLTFDLTGAYAASLVLGALAVLALCGMNALRVRGQVRGQGSGVRGQVRGQGSGVRGQFL